jgi:hypothetical protein
MALHVFFDWCSVTGGRSLPFVDQFLFGPFAAVHSLHIHVECCYRMVWIKPNVAADATAAFFLVSLLVRT